MLAEINKHINDDKISFDEANHDYFVGGKKIKFSVTEIIDKFFPKFDKAYWAERKAKEKLELDHIDYDSEILESVINQILNGWEKKRIDAASKGTILHHVSCEALKNKTSFVLPLPTNDFGLSNSLKQFGVQEGVMEL